MQVQYELNLDAKSPEEMQLDLMQKQIDEMWDSVGKVRRKMFAELGEMKKIFAEVQMENAELKTMLNDIKPQSQSVSL